MANNSMGLPIPVVGVDTGPTWANQINNCLNLIAEHTHASGSGVQITPAGLNINSPLLFNGNPIQSTAYVNIIPQNLGVPVPINASVYVNGVDLFFRDGVGNAVRITQGGNVLASSSGISSGTASASFVGSVLTVIQAPGVAAPIDAASYILRYNGSYPTPSGNAIILQAPSSLSTVYALTLPATLPAFNNAILSSSTSGSIGYLTADQVATDITPVGANAIGLDMTTTAANLKSGGKYVVVSETGPASETSMNIVRGIINGTTLTNISGEGWNVSRPTTGQYVITPLGGSSTGWVVTASPYQGPQVVWASVLFNGAFNFTIFLRNSGGSPVNVDFSFIAIGSRLP